MSVYPHSPKTCNHRDEPTYWFALMEIARKRGDFKQAVEAKRELMRLGVRVNYGRGVPSDTAPPLAEGGRDA